MRIELSILASALLQVTFVAWAMLGSWQVEPLSPPSHLFDDASHTVALEITPPPPVLLLTPPPIEEQVEPPTPVEEDEPVATTTRKTPPPSAPEKKKEEPPKKTPRVAQKPPTQQPEPPREPEAAQLKLVVASKKADAPASPAELAEHTDTPVAAVAPGASIVPPVSPPSQGAYASSATDTPPGAGSQGALSDVDRAGLLKSYKKLLFSTIDRNKSVPRAARRARLQGTVYVLVTFDDQGNILSLKVRKSSGHAVLDEGALDTIRSIKKLPAPPQALGWSKKSLTIPIRYKI